MSAAAGLDVVASDTTDDALSRVSERADHFDGVFPDLRMSAHGDGLELAGAVARKGPRVSVVLTSGESDPQPDLGPSVTFVPQPWLPLGVPTSMQNAAEWGRASA